MTSIKDVSIKDGKRHVGWFAVVASLLASGCMAIAVHGQEAGVPATAQATTARPPKVAPPGIKIPGVARPLSELKPETVYPVEGSPDWSVITRDAVWVSSARVDHVVQLLPSTGKPGLIATVQ